MTTRHQRRRVSEEMVDAMYGNPAERGAFTRTQCKQYLILHHMERYEELGRSPQKYLLCRDCDMEKPFMAASTGISLLRVHAGHRTWLEIQR